MLSKCKEKSSLLFKRKETKKDIRKIIKTKKKYAKR